MYDWSVFVPIPSDRYPSIYPPLKSEIQDILIRWIVEMQLTPEEKISDKEIAAYFKVSRTPIRETLKVLERQKLICTYPGKATVVAKLGIENLEQWYLPMQTLQCLAVRLAVDNACDDDIGILEEINADFAQQVALRTNAMELLELDQKFHNKILKIAQNEYIIDFCNTLSVHIARLDYLFFKKTLQLESSFADHKRIIEGLRLKDTITAEFAMKSNWSNSMLEVKAQIGKYADDNEKIII